MLVMAQRPWQRQICVLFLHFQVPMHQTAPHWVDTALFPSTPRSFPRTWITTFIDSKSLTPQQTGGSCLIKYSVLLCIYGPLCFEREWKKPQEHGLQSAGPTSSVPPWRGGQRWPQHHRTPRFHAGRAGARCGEQDSRDTFRNNGLHRAYSGEHILKHLKRQFSQKIFPQFPPSEGWTTPAPQVNTHCWSPALADCTCKQTS